MGVAEESYNDIELPLTVKSIAKGALGSYKIKKLILSKSIKKIIEQNFKANPEIAEGRLQHTV